MLLASESSSSPDSLLTPDVLLHRYPYTCVHCKDLDPRLPSKVAAQSHHHYEWTLRCLYLARYYAQRCATTSSAGDQHLHHKTT